MESLFPVPGTGNLARLNYEPVSGPEVDAEADTTRYTEMSVSAWFTGTDLWYERCIHPIGWDDSDRLDRWAYREGSAWL